MKNTVITRVTEGPTLIRVQDAAGLPSIASAPLVQMPTQEKGHLATTAA